MALSSSAIDDSVGRDPLDQAGQDPAGADLDECGDAGSPHRSTPRPSPRPWSGGRRARPGRRRRSSRARRPRWRAAAGADRGRRRRRGRSRIPSAASPSAASAPRRYRQHDGALGAEALRDARAPPRSPRRSPDTTTWPGALRLATTKTPQAAALCDELRQLGVVETDERRHGARRARRRRPASGGPARGRGARASCEVEGTGGDERRVLAHRVAGGEGGVRDGNPSRRPALADCREVSRSRSPSSAGWAFSVRSSVLRRTVPGEPADRARRGRRRRPRTQRRPRARSRRGPRPMPTAWRPARGRRRRGDSSSRSVFGCRRVPGGVRAGLQESGLVPTLHA